jgi:large subunit ribosomal protein L4
MKLNVLDLTGNTVKQITLNKEVFEADVNSDLMAQAVRVYLANQRKATAKTLTRGEIDRTTKKVYRQKGTGGARHGNRKAPIYVGGGIAHGPRGNQNYTLKLSQKMKVGALRSALSQKAAAKSILVVDGFEKIEKPNTKTIATFLTKALGENYRNVAIVFDKGMDNAVKSARNLDNLKYCNGSTLNTYDVLKANSLIFSVQALENVTNSLIK